MSDLGEISAELSAALNRLARAADRFAEIDRRQLASVQAELSRSPQGQQAAALIARARALVGQAQAGARAARGAGSGWLSQHGSGEAGGSGGGIDFGGPVAAPIGDGEGGGSFSSAAVRSAAAASVRTPGGRAYFDASETHQRAAAAALPPFDGEYTFIGHGASDRVVVGGHHLSAAEVAELIRADPEWGGRPVRLLSCNTGRGENPIAARLAAELGVEVTAPDDVAWSSAEGWVAVAPIKVEVIDGEELSVPDWDRQGSWRVFRPGERKER